MYFSLLLSLLLATAAIARPASQSEVARTTETTQIVFTVTAPPIVDTTTATIPGTPTPEVVTTQTTSSIFVTVVPTVIVTVAPTAVVTVAPTAGATALPTALAMTLINRLDDDLVLSFRVGKDQDQKEFESAYGHPGVKPLPTGSAAVYEFPPNWDGIIEVGYEPNVDNSLIEGNTLRGAIDIDVSYVQGYSVPIVCSHGGSVVTGCNKQLFDHGECPAADRRGTRVCHNSAREPDAASAAPFFTPCQSAAITFPTDGGNYNPGPSSSRDVTCCIGDENACPANPAQRPV